MPAGFIHDKMEIRFLILYIASRVAEPMLSEELQELTMIDDGINYFDFSVCLADLVKTGHLLLDEEGYYTITEKGQRNSAICESDIPYSVRLRADREIALFRQKLLRRAQIQGKFHPRDNGTYTVELQMRDDLDELMHLQLMVATREMAEDLVKRFKKNPEEIFTQILSALFGK